MSAPVLETEPHAATQLRSRFRLALVLIALLTLASLAAMQFGIAAQVHDSRVVNIAGRQRMLSQQLAKAGFALAATTDTARRTELARQLRDALALWQRAHIGLQVGDTELRLPGDNSEEIGRRFRQLEPIHRELVGAVNALLAAAPQGPAMRQALATIADHEPRFLRAMDDIVFTYDAEAAQRVEFARALQVVLAALTLLALAAVGQFVFAPAIGRLRVELRHRAEREADMQMLFSASPSALLMVDADGLRVTRCNRRAEQLLGVPPESLLERPLGDFIDTRQTAGQEFLRALRVGEAVDEREVVLLDERRAALPALVSSCRIAFAGRRVCVVGLTGIAELKKAQQTLQYYATFDELSGLVNRRTGLLLLEKQMARAKRDGTRLTVCFGDLDGLKATNDAHGHQEGDWLIRTASAVMSESIRKGDVAVRLGGDEFLLVLHDCDPQQAQPLIERIEHGLLDAAARAGKGYEIGLSFGVAAYDPSRHADEAALVADADHRMYESKQARKTVW